MSEALFRIDGWGTGSGGEHDVVDAATGERIGSVHLATEADVDTAGRAARAAQPAWAEASFRTRIDVLLRAEAILNGFGPDLAPLLSRETGSLPIKAAVEIEKSADELRTAAALPDQPYGELLPNIDPRVLSIAQRVPVGVVGIITPWNVPLGLAMRSVAPALALGNAVLLKPDVKTPLSGGAVIAEALQRAGLPDGLLHVLPGRADIGEAVVRSPHTDVISFTGSSAAGRRVGEIAGGLLKRVVLELGGNNAFIVLDDADLDAAVRSAARGTFFHQGQICMATGRHLVHEALADEYVGRLTSIAKGMRVGDPKLEGTTLGPLIDLRQAERVQSIVDEAIAGGAVATTGGTHDRQFYAPTVLDHVDVDNAAFQTEIFGPVAPVTRFSSDEEALSLVGASEYGLTAAIHTADYGRGLALARRIRAGMVHVNGSNVADDAHVPMGGMGASGNGGRYGGHWNIDEFTYTQWVTAAPVS